MRDLDLGFSLKELNEGITKDQCISLAIKLILISGPSVDRKRSHGAAFGRLCFGEGFSLGFVRTLDSKSTQLDGKVYLNTFWVYYSYIPTSYS